MRLGEAWKLKWTALDCQSDSVRVTPEKRSKKRSKPGIFKLSSKLVAMLKALPLEGGFRKQRRRIAAKLKNPRINRITFEILRHFKGTMEYHRTKDILHVKEVLGHRSLKNTLVYTHLVEFENDEFVSKVAEDAKEACELVEAGFEFVCPTQMSLWCSRRGSDGTVHGVRLWCGGWDSNPRTPTGRDLESRASSP